MKTTYSSLMHSKFFNPAFNSAIFDGPVRIYFAQFHESLALKVYFSLQQNFAQEMSKAKELSKRLGHNILIMIYPTQDSFSFAFEEDAHAEFGVGALTGDTVIGMRVQDEDEAQFKFLHPIMTHAIQAWQLELEHQSSAAQVEL